MFSVELLFYAVGCFTLLKLASNVVKFFLRLWNESLWSKTLDFKKFGNWAVVTGASDGIGKGVAIELAKYGMNVVLISRTQSKLKKVAEELQAFNVEVKVIAVDFTSGDAIYDVIKDEIKDLDISVLVNNVGIAWVKETALLDIPNYEKYSRDAIKVNVSAMVKMTEIVLPVMVKNGGGNIVNISSVVGSRTSPYYAVYGATKSCVITYTKCMAEEYGPQGVAFQCIAPALTATPMAGPVLENGNFLAPSAELYGKYVVKAIGKSVYTNTGYYGHNLFQIILWIIPDFLFAKIFKNLTKKQKKLHHNNDTSSAFMCCFEKIQYQVNMFCVRRPTFALW